MFWNNVEVMLTLVSLDLQNIRTLVRKSLKSEGRAFESYSSFSYCTHSTTLYWLLPSDQDIDCIQIDYI